MEFIKNYNNNAALVKDSAGKDWVVIGKGIGFGLKKGMPVDESKIERRFLAQDEIDQVEPEVVKGIDPQSFEASAKCWKTSTASPLPATSTLPWLTTSTS